jgi:hypothetical protein
MRYKIVMRKTITDPNERWLRLKRHYEILISKSDFVQPLDQNTVSDLDNVTGYKDQNPSEQESVYASS